MSLVNFLPAVVSSTMGCAGHDLESYPARIHHTPSRQPTISHPPSFSAPSFTRLRSKSNQHSGEYKSTLSNPASPRRSRQSQPIAPEEYDALPASVQRKYFSPAERLRIAQQSAAQKRQKQRSADLSSNRTSYETCQTSIHSRSRTSYDFVSTTSASPRSTLAVKSPTQLEFDQKFISADQALWFLTLPEKVLRQQFSTEERARLMQRCESILHHAAPDLSSHRQSVHSPPLHYAVDAAAVQLSTRLPEAFTADDRLKSIQLETDSMSSTRSSGVIEANSTVVQHSPSTPVAKQTSTFNGMYSPLTMSSPVEALPQLARPRSKSMARASALTPVFLPPPTLAPHTLAKRATLVQSSSPSPLVGRPRPSPSMPHLLAFSNTRSSQDCIPTHRNKNLKSMSSSQGFNVDQGSASRYGSTGSEDFLQDTAPPSPTLIIMRSATDADSDVDDDANSLDSKGPMTPNNPYFGPQPTRIQRTGSEDLNGAISVQPPNHVASKSSLDDPANTFDDFVNREMTVRITLTRPELQDLGRKIYRGPRRRSSSHNVTSPPRNSDLEALPACGRRNVAPDLLPHDSPSRKGFIRALNPFRRH